MPGPADYSSAMTFATGQIPGSTGPAVGQGGRGSLGGIADQKVVPGLERFSPSTVVKWGVAPPPTLISPIRGGILGGIIACQGGIFDLSKLHADLAQIRQGGDSVVAANRQAADSQLASNAAQAAAQAMANIGVNFGGSQFLGGSGGLGRRGAGGVVAANFVPQGGIEMT